MVFLSPGYDTTVENCYKSAEFWQDTSLGVLENSYFLLDDFPRLKVTILSEKCLPSRNREIQHSFILIYSSMILKEGHKWGGNSHHWDSFCVHRISFRIYKIQTAENAAIWGSLSRDKNFILLSSKCGFYVFLFHLFQGRVSQVWKGFWSSECNLTQSSVNHFLKEKLVSISFYPKEALQISFKWHNLILRDLALINSL